MLFTYAKYVKVRLERDEVVYAAVQPVHEHAHVPTRQASTLE